jgi:hypothetical protein
MMMSEMGGKQGSFKLSGIERSHGGASGILAYLRRMHSIMQQLEVGGMADLLFTYPEIINSNLCLLRYKLHKRSSA